MAKNMKILLLGANGQLGTDIIRLHSKKYSNHQLVALNRNCLDVLNLHDVKSYLTSHEFDILINCVSFNRTEECETRKYHAFVLNAFSVNEMAKACKIKNARLVHFSSDYVFGHQPFGQPLDELTTPSPLSTYGLTKLTGENLALSAHDDVLILRTASLFGRATSSSKKGNFVESIYHTANNTGYLKVINDIYMSPTASIDLADMTFKLINVNAPSGIYHAVNSGQASWYELAKTILKQTKIKAEIEPITAKEYNSILQRPYYSVLNNSKIKAIVGDIPNWEYSLEQYLKDQNYIK